LGVPNPMTSAMASDSNDGGSGETSLPLDDGASSSESGGLCLNCTQGVDILFVIDNSGTMGVEQRNLARNFPLLVRQLEGLTDRNGRAVEPDIQIMVTTTDFSNPVCTEDAPPGYESANGSPIANTCLARADRFTSRMGGDSEIAACESVCLNPAAAPEGDPFIAFQADRGDNIPDDVVPADIDGDGTVDSAVSQALACMGPQGINGCGFESPLENMLQALNPDAAWNSGSRPFLRPDAVLAIVIITDEVDCSVRPAEPGQPYLLLDPTYQEVHPLTNQAAPTSAVCWNAGVTCDAPSADGVYTDCRSSDTGGLHPISRYVNYLVDNLRDGRNKEIVMLGILGVPPVTAHNDQVPYEPTAGGVEDLVYRDWTAADILPGQNSVEGDDDAQLEAAFNNYDFGIGPGCTGGNAETGFTGQAIPPVRIKEVCEALDIRNTDGTTETRCCIESICDDDYSPAMKCLTGILSAAINTG